MDISIQVRKRGVLTLPSELREKYKIEAGDTYHLIDIEGTFVLTPMTPIITELAHEIEKLRLEAGLTTEELLENLRMQRQRYYQEHYAPNSSPIN